MPAGIEEHDHVALLDGQSAWWIPPEGSIHATVMDVEVTAQEALDLAHQRWTVEKVPAYDMVPNEDGVLVPEIGMTDKKGNPTEFWNRRTDNYLKLGRSGTRYEVFQNESGAEFVDFLTDGGYKIDTAGSLFNCKHVWMLLKLSEDIVIGGDPRETIENWLCFTNTHDGSGAITLAIVKIRVVCANTLAWALSGAKRVFKVRHTESLEGKMQDAREALAMTFKYDEKFAVTAERLIDQPMLPETIEIVMEKLVPLKDASGAEKTGRALTVATNMRNTIMGLYQNSDNLQHLPECKWRFVQAVEEYSDHMAVYRNTTAASAAETRFKRLVDGDTLGNQAFALLA